MYIFFELTLAQPFISFRKGCGAQSAAQGKVKPQSYIQDLTRVVTSYLI